MIFLFDLHSIKLSLFSIQLLLSFGEFSLSDDQTSLLQGQVSLWRDTIQEWKNLCLMRLILFNAQLVRADLQTSKHVIWTRVYLQRQDLLVDAEEVNHGLGPGAESGHVATGPLGWLHVVVVHVQVGRQQLHHLLCDAVLQHKHTDTVDNAALSPQVGRPHVIIQRTELKQLVN